MSVAMTLAQVNALSTAEFVARFGDVAEHSPWVAEGAAARRPFASRDEMIQAFAEVMRAAAEASQLALVQAHPDLAGKAALTDDSKREQAGAGLDTLTRGEFDSFTSLNDAYKDRFGFPFIFAVKGATKHQILAAFEERLKNDRETEFETALGQIARILRFRIEDRVQP